jgi:hypothetical protein
MAENAVLCRFLSAEDAEMLNRQGFLRFEVSGEPQRASRIFLININRYLVGQAASDPAKGLNRHI